MRTHKHSTTHDVRAPHRGRKHGVPRTEKAGRRRSALRPMRAAGCSARLMQYDSGYQYLHAQGSGCFGLL